MVPASSRMILIATMLIISTTQFASAVLQLDPNFPYKRVPQGFLGMRGKKDQDFHDLPARGMQEFIGAKGKNPDDDHLYLKHTPIEILNHMQNRDMSTLYGKIDYEVTATDRGDDIFPPYWDRLEENDSRKRIHEVNKERDEDFWSSYNDYLSQNIAKKADKMSAFYGMRGKKLQSKVFRGKKTPIDFSFRGKFIGVRGKKSERENWDDTAEILSAPKHPIYFNTYTRTG